MDSANLVKRATRAYGKRITRNGVLDTTIQMEPHAWRENPGYDGDRPTPRHPPRRGPAPTKAAPAKPTDALTRKAAPGRTRHERSVGVASSWHSPPFLLSSANATTPPPHRRYSPVTTTRSTLVLSTDPTGAPTTKT